MVFLFYVHKEEMIVKAILSLHMYINIGIALALLINRIIKLQ